LNSNKSSQLSPLQKSKINLLVYLFYLIITAQFQGILNRREPDTLAESKPVQIKN